MSRDFRRKSGIIALVAIIGFTMAACGGGDDPDPACDHVWGEWVTTTPAGMTTDGVETRTCTLDASHTETRPIPSVRSAIDALEGGDSADAPASFKVSVDLGNMRDYSSGWGQLLSAINGAGKYVSLDLSGCTPTASGSFGPSPVIEQGKDKIVNLILPDAAKSIMIGEGSYNATAFWGFTALRSVSGEGIETICENAFRGLTALESVSFPNAKTIGRGSSGGNSDAWIGGAFQGCSALKSVSLPKAEYIGYRTFGSCGALESISLPAATEISWRTFDICPALVNVSLPLAINIPMVLIDSNVLASVTLGEVTSFNATQDGGPFSSLRTVVMALPAGSRAGTYTRTPPSTTWTKQ